MTDRLTGMSLAGRAASTGPIPLRPVVRRVGEHSRHVGQNFRATFNNNRAESLPLLFWTAWAGFVLFLHYATQDPGALSSLFFALAAAPAFFLWLELSGKARGSNLTIEAGAIAFLIWSGCGTAFGLSTALVVAWILILVSAYIPFLKMLLEVKHTPPIQLTMPAALEAPVQVDEFEKWPAMKGGRQLGPIHRTETGHVRRYELPVGKSARDMVEGGTDGWANFLQTDVAAIELVEVAGNARLLDVFTHTQDAHKEAAPWPVEAGQETDFYGDILFGRLRSGAPVYLNLTQQNILLAGVPGAGKTASMRILLAAAAMDPHASLYLLDGKSMDMGAWKNRAVRYVGSDIAEANKILRQVEGQIAERVQAINEYNEDADHKISKVHDAPTGLFSRIILAADELEKYATDSNTQAAAEFQRLFQRIGKEGRAVGINIIASTQRPTSEVLAPGILAIFQQRVAFKCADAAMTRFILGNEKSKVDASRIPAGAANQGKAYLVDEVSAPRLIRTYWLSEDAAWQIGQRTAADYNPVPAIEAPKVPALHSVPTGDLATFPDGQPIRSPWMADLWDALLDDEPKTIQQLSTEVSEAKTEVTFRRVLTDWSERRYVEASGKKPVTYRRAAA